MGHYKLNENSSLFLDLLRTLTAQVVVVGHGMSFFSICPFLQPPHFPYLQNIAVLIFFLLSGFLISYSINNNIQKNPGYSFRSFFIDRFSRIYTAYLPAIALIILLDVFHLSVSGQSYLYHTAFNLKTVVGNVFMLQDFPLFSVLKKANLSWLDPITSLGSARPFWTLAVEWWIYLWVGYFVFKIAKNTKISLQNMLLFLFFSMVPVFNLISGRGNGLTVYWLLGTVVYLLSGKFQEYGLRKSIRWSVLLLFLLAASARVFLTMKEYEPVLAFLLAMSLLVSLSLAYDTEVFRKYAKLIRFTANYSFTLYLVHYTVLDILASFYKGVVNSYVLFLVGFLIANALSALLGYYTEMKATKIIKDKLKERFVSKHSV